MRALTLAVLLHRGIVRFDVDVLSTCVRATDRARHVLSAWHMSPQRGTTHARRVPVYKEPHMRVGLIGSGYWATTVHGASVAGHPRADLVGVWGRNPAKAAEAATTLGTRPYADVAALIADVDALTFAVPPDVQADIALQALRARKHVLLEKPLSLTVADAHAIEAAAEQSGVASIVFFTRRFVA